MAVLLTCGGVQAAFAQSVPTAFLLYPNYRGLIFSDHPEIVVDAPSGASVTVRDKVSGSTVATATMSGTAATRIASSSMTQNHPYTVTVTLGGTTLGTWEVTAVPATERSTMNISHDRDGRLLMHGRPRFGLGVYDSGLNYFTDPALYESTLFAPGSQRQLGGVNLNLYLNYHYGQAPLPAMEALMTSLQNHGMMYLQTANCFNTGSYTRIPFTADQGTYATDFAKHPGAAGFYIMDECVDALIPETTQHHHALSGRAPGTMTLAVTLAGPKVDARKWAGASDVLGTDPYPLYGAEPAQGYSHFQVADYVAYAKSAVRDSRPIFSVLQFFKFTSDSRWPTPGEQRAHAIMSIVEGADGLFWWEIGQNGLQKDSAQFATQMAVLKANVNELAALEHVLVAPDATGALVGNSTKYADEKAGRIAQLQLSKTNSWLFHAKTMYQSEIDRINAGDLSHSPMLKGAADIRTKTKVVGGKGYVFAYNYTNKTLPVTFTWQGAPGSVTENKSGQSYPVSGNSWNDTLGAYESRIYVIANGGTGPGDPPPAESPTVAFSNPTSGATVSGTATVSVAASGGSGSGYSYKIAVGGTQVYSGTNPSFSWNTTMAANGAQTLTATVTDSAGKTGTANRSVTVSNTVTPPPPTSFTAAFSAPTADGTTVSGTRSIGMTTTAPSGISKTWTLTVDGQTVRTATTTGTVLWRQLDTTTLANGMRTLKVTVTINGVSASATRTINVANAGAPPPPPLLTAAFSGPASGATLSETATVGMSSTGGATGSRTFTLEQVVGTTATVLSTQTVTGTTASFAWDTTTVANGAVTLRLTVRDAAGATATSSQSVTVTNLLPATYTVSFSNPTTDGVTMAGNKSIGLATTAPWGQSKTWTIMVDGQVLTTVTNTATVFWYTLNTTTLTNGTRTIKATVVYNGMRATVTRTINVAN